MSVPTAAQQAQLNALWAAYQANPTPTNLSLFVNAREMYWRGQAFSGLLDDGVNGGSGAQGPPNTRLYQTGGSPASPPRQPGNPPGAVELGS